MDSCRTIDGWEWMVLCEDGTYRRRPVMSKVAKDIVTKRYASCAGEDWTLVCKRVSGRLAHLAADLEGDPSSRREEFERVMLEGEFVPAGRTLRNCGSADASRTVPNCIVLPIPDSIEGIFQTLKEAAVLQKAGAGLGFSLDLLRPAGAPLKSSAGASSGAVSFLTVYNTAFGVIKQQNRSGANMAIMSVDHPDILDFLSAKREEGVLRNFNISVALTDRFMHELGLLEENRVPWRCTWGGQSYPLRTIVRSPTGAISIAEHPGMTAVDLFHIIAKHAWENGEPGVVFLDRVNETNPLPGLGKIRASNPCGTSPSSRRMLTN